MRRSWGSAVSLLLIGLFVAVAIADDGVAPEEDPFIGHKALSPLDSYDQIGFLLIFLMGAIAAGGGIGGGGIFVPILILVMGFAIKGAIPLSSICILGGSIFHIFRNFHRRHPTADRPLIDWTFIALMQPMLVCGAVIGSFLNKIVPDWALAIKLVIILGFTAHRTFNNGMKKWRKERAELEAMPGEGTAEEKDPAWDKAMADMPEDVPSEELAQLLQDDKELPTFKMAMAVVVTAGVLALNLARGSESAGFNPFNIECGSGGYYFLSLAVIPYCGAAYYLTRNHVLEQYMARVAAEWEFHEGDVEWDEHKIWKYPLYGIFSGVIAGMFGIGGGMINGPLMVELGFLPEVAVATGATTLLFTSATSTIMYVQLDLMNYEYALPLFVIGFLSTVVGQIMFNKVMEAYKRDSLIIFTIAGIVFASACLMGIEGMFIFTNFMNGESHAITGICEKVADAGLAMPMNHGTVTAAYMFIVMMTVIGGMQYAFRSDEFR